MRDSRITLPISVPTIFRKTRIVRVDGADHSFKVPKSSGRTQREVLDEVAVSVRDFVLEALADDAR